MSNKLQGAPCPLGPATDIEGPLSYVLKVDIAECIEMSVKWQKLSSMLFTFR